MDDQVMLLKSRNVSAARLGKSSAENELIRDNSITVIYSNPEALLDGCCDSVRLVQDVELYSNVVLLVVDEIHAVLQW